MKEILEQISMSLGLDDAGKAALSRGVAKPPNSSSGDVAIACFGLAKLLRESPPKIAARIKENWTDCDVVEKVEVVGPYVNLFWNRVVMTNNVIMQVLSEGPNYGRQNIGKGETIVLDYSHPNIAKPFHVGHLRSTNLGAALHQIFEFLGFNVWRQNYIGDWGTQFGYVLYGWLKQGDVAELERRSVHYLVELYIQANKEAKQDDTIQGKARDLFSKLERGDPELLKLWSQFREISLKAFHETYHRLGLKFDSYDGEAAITEKVPAVVERFENSGIAICSEGALIVHVDDVIGRPIAPLMLRKSDGTTTYAARDCAEAIRRWEEHPFSANIYVVARQEDHFAQVFAALQKLGKAEGWPVGWASRCENIGFGFVRGMSTRKGEIQWLSDVLDEAKSRAVAKTESQTPEGIEDFDVHTENIGQAALRFFDMSSQRKNDLTFDWDSVLKFEGRTGPYLQYTTARLYGILRKASISDCGDPNRSDVDASLIVSDSEWDVVKLLHEFPNAVAASARCREPFLIAKYLYDLCQSVNSFYHKHKVVVTEDEQLTNSRLAIVRVVLNVMEIGCKLIGIKPLERM